MIAEELEEKLAQAVGIIKILIENVDTRFIKASDVAKAKLFIADYTFQDVDKSYDIRKLDPKDDLPF